MSQQSSFCADIFKHFIATTGNITPKYGVQCKSSSLNYAVTIVGETKLHLLRPFTVCLQIVSIGR
jgi:hypothetical protein